MKAIFLIALGAVVLALIVRFVRQVRRVREVKARVRLAHRKWLLERADDCAAKRRIYDAVEDEARRRGKPLYADKR